MDPTPPLPVTPGQILAGKYRVDRVLGAGGMGVVVAATHLQLEERVALKFLLGGQASAEDLQRFRREAQNSVRIKSEHAVRVSDVGSLEDGAPYMVMEYLEGEDLEQLLARRGPLPIAELVDYVLQACEAIAEAHQLRIIHRDLKPANLFVTRRSDGSPLVKVLDFGLSKALAASEAQKLTATSSAMGSPVYMSPEQIRDVKNAGPPTDLWALGIILFELAAGRPPFLSGSVSGVLAAIMVDGFPPLRSFRPDTPAALEAAIAQCLMKDPAARMPSVAALASALAPLASADGQTSVRRILGARAGSPPVGGRAGTSPTTDPHALAPASDGSRVDLGHSATLVGSAPTAVGSSPTVVGAPAFGASAGSPARTAKDWSRDVARSADRRKPWAMVVLVAAPLVVGSVALLVWRPWGDPSPGGTSTEPVKTGASSDGSGDEAPTPGPEPSSRPAATPPDLPIVAPAEVQPGDDLPAKGAVTATGTVDAAPSSSATTKPVRSGAHAAPPGTPKPPASSAPTAGSWSKKREL